MSIADCTQTEIIVSRKGSRKVDGNHDDSADLIR